mmetsp:Transcript_823/g.2153  ORF Transcript_823/g.2153 Transcript_823/m.2153 type:complete len:258 (-) Transcript_823:435-1208(-)
MGGQRVRHRRPAPRRHGEEVPRHGHSTVQGHDRGHADGPLAGPLRDLRRPLRVLLSRGGNRRADDTARHGHCARGYVRGGCRAGACARNRAPADQHPARCGRGRAPWADLPATGGPGALWRDGGAGARWPPRRELCAHDAVSDRARARLLRQVGGRHLEAERISPHAGSSVARSLQENPRAHRVKRLRQLPQARVCEQNRKVPHPALVLLQVHGGSKSRRGGAQASVAWQCGVSDARRSCETGASWPRSALAHAHWP